MVPRKSHRKSRYGCVVCKRRRVKCDEQGPPCNNCIGQRLKCEYLTGPISMRTVPGQQTPTSSSAPGVQEIIGAPLPTTYNPSRRLLELQLLHHWTSNTHQTFATKRANQEDERRKWQIEAVREALNHDFLLSAILAVTAMHISIDETASRTPSEISHYRLVALEYHDDASKKFRAGLLGPLTPDSHTAAFVFSILTMAMSLAFTQWPSSRTLNQPITHTESSIQHIKTFFHMIQGIRSIFNQTYQSLSSGPFRVRDGAPLGDRDLPPELACTNVGKETDYVITDLLAENESPRLTGPYSTEDHRQTYCEMLHLLKRAFAGVQPDEYAESTMLWAAYLSADFLENLKADEPMALLIVMHWAVLLHRFRDAWWIGSVSRTLVSEISHYLLSSIRGKQMEERMRELVAWPREQVGLGPPMQRLQLGKTVPIRLL